MGVHCTCSVSCSVVRGAVSDARQCRTSKSTFRHRAGRYWAHYVVFEHFLNGERQSPIQLASMSAMAQSGHERLLGGKGNRNVVWVTYVRLEHGTQQTEEQKMEHRRTASFGVYSLLLAATTSVAAQSNEQTAGPYRGMYVCQNKLGAGPDILRVPIDLVVRNGNVEFARPLLNWNGTRIIGNEMAHGTTDPDGKIHLTSTWYNGGIIF